MSTPEIIPQQPRAPEVTPRVEQPIVPETLQQAGVQTQPQPPKPVTNDDNTVLVQPVVTTPAYDPATTLTVPTTVAMNEKELEKGAQGPANLSVTWLDMYWLRQVGQALKKGWRVLFGQG